MLLALIVVMPASGCQPSDPALRFDARLKREGGVRLVYEIDEPRLKPGQTVDIALLTDAVQRRIAKNNPWIRVSSGPDKQITVLLAGRDQDELARVKKLLGSQGLLEFRIMADKDADEDIVQRAREGNVEDPPIDASRASDDDETKYLIDEAERLEAEHAAATEEALKKNQPLPLPLQYILLEDRARAEWVDVPAKDVAAALANKELVTRTIKPSHVQKLVILGELLARWVPVGKDEVGKLRVVPTEMVSRPNAGGGFDVLVLLDVQNVEGKYLNAVAAGSDPRHRSVDFEFGAEGARRFSMLTGNNEPKGSLVRKLGILLDNELLTAPQLRSRISNRGQITGDYSKADVEWIVGVLDSGSLPAPLKTTPVREEQVPPASP